MKHRPHGYTVREDFAKGDLVQWNHWKLSDEYREDARGLRTFDRYMVSHLGIVLRVYQSTSKARCWTADIKFIDAELNSDYWGLDGRPIPLGCLVKLS
jgi:hypothetical protein